METVKTVVDEKQKITDEQIGKIQKKTNEIVRRINEGTIFFDDVIAGMQDIIEGASKRLKLDLIPEKKWCEKDGVIYFKVISDGTTGEKWITRLEEKGFKLSDYAKELLLSRNFKSTTGIVYTIAVLKGNRFANDNRATKEIRSRAENRKFVTPNPEVACLIRYMFTDDEIKSMGLSWIVTFHKPIQDSDGGLGFLSTNNNNGGSWLNANYDHSDGGWCSGFGFAFEVSRRNVA